MLGLPVGPFGLRFQPRVLTRGHSPYVRPQGPGPAPWAGTKAQHPRISLFALKDGKQPRFDATDDDTILLDEIRRDRALRGETVPDGGVEED